MSNLQKSERFDLKDKFNDISRYLDDIFTIDNPEFAEHIPDIYPRELQLNKANTTVTLPKPTVARRSVSKKLENRATSADCRPTSAPILADFLVGRRLFCRSTQV